MPTYEFMNTKGEIIEEVMTVSEMERRFPTIGSKGHLHGKKVTRVLAEAPNTQLPSRYPHKSWSRGCHPDQIPEMRKTFADKGVPTDFYPDGDMKIESAEHRKKVDAIMGIIEKNGTDG